MNPSNCCFSRDHMDWNEDIEKNISKDRNTIFLPENDEEWINLLEIILKVFKKNLANMWKKSNENRKNNEFDFWVSPHILSTSALHYRIKILEKLLIRQYVNKKDLYDELINENEDVDEIMFEQGWLEIMDLLSMVYLPNPYSKNDTYWVFKNGKAVIRSIMNDSDYPYPLIIGGNQDIKHGTKNDYLPRNDYQRKELQEIINN